ncbi:hypothetical protein [Maritalea myrionectae]|uniref:hypothetical protein n=1 Tax=Maritalea myrionectae TaxID=454601 RepID=UPI000427C962|nr:hypothetical protein [Maritalea myrionectae]
MINSVSIQFAHIGRLVVVFFCILSLAACTVGGVNDRKTSSANQTPEAERIGAGTVTVGLLVNDDYDGLSDGAVNAPYLAGKLAAQKLTKTPITLVVRRAGNDGASLRNNAASLRSANVDIIVTDVDAAQSAQLAAELSGSLIPVITLAQAANIDRMLYSAPTDVPGEAGAIAEQARALKVKKAYIIRTESARSGQLVGQLEGQLAQKRIQTETIYVGSVDVTSLQQRAIEAQSAIIFATSPKFAASFLDGRAGQPQVRTIFGNGDWALDTNAYASLVGAYIPTPTENKLSSFAQLFKTSFGQNASIRSATIYDLVVLTGALPQIAGAEAYTPRILTNDKGFKGQMGWFRFDDEGRSIRKWIVVKRQ